jgi:multicomponent Na+:H+ antiporter subunit E
VFLRFSAYIPWLTIQIFKANIHVAALALHPNPPIDPRIIRFKTKLKTDISLVTFANSITLTPGTITMDIIEGEFYVHALDRKVMKDLGTGEMENRIAHIFMEEDQTNIKGG